MDIKSVIISVISAKGSKFVTARNNTTKVVGVIIHSLIGREFLNSHKILIENEDLMIYNGKAATPSQGGR